MIRIIQSSPKDLHLSNPKTVSKPSETMVFEGLFFMEKSNKKDHICTALKKAKMDNAPKPTTADTPDNKTSVTPK